jgi:glycosyltransferase involved in cell wall biosynthesis
MGKPVIVSDHVGCHHDLVQPGQNGLVFPSGDVAKLRQRLVDALQFPERLRHWGTLSRQRIQQYTYHQVTHGLKSALIGL